MLLVSLNNAESQCKRRQLDGLSCGFWECWYWIRGLLLGKGLGLHGEQKDVLRQLRMWLIYVESPLDGGEK